MLPSTKIVDGRPSNKIFRFLTTPGFYFNFGHTPEQCLCYSTTQAPSKSNVWSRLEFFESITQTVIIVMQFTILLNKALKHSASLTFFSLDAKCKISVAEPYFPLAYVACGKNVVGLNELFQVADHDFTKISVIPYAVFV